MLPRSALLRMIIVAWHILSASKKTSLIKYSCLKLYFGRQDIYVFFFLSSIVNSIQLKWWVSVLFTLNFFNCLLVLFNNSIGDGLNIAIDNVIKTIFGKPKMPQSKRLIHVLLKWSDISSIVPGDGCQLIAWSWLVTLLNELYASKKVTAVYLDLRWCIWMPFLLIFFTNFNLFFFFFFPSKTWDF